MNKSQNNQANKNQTIFKQTKHRWLGRVDFSLIPVMDLNATGTAILESLISNVKWFCFFLKRTNYHFPNFKHSKQGTISSSPLVRVRIGDPNVYSINNNFVILRVLTDVLVPLAQAFLLFYAIERFRYLRKRNALRTSTGILT